MSLVTLTTILGAVLAGALAYFDLVAIKYPRTFFLVRGCPYLLLHALVYAALAAIVMGLYEYVAPHDGPHSPIGGNLWVRAFLVGFFLNSFLHSRILTLPGTPEPVVVSLDRILVRFEPTILASIERHHESAEVSFIDLHITGLTLDQVKTAILENLPIDMNENDRNGFSSTIEQTTQSRRAATLYLRLVGRSRFHLTFPARDPVIA